MNDIKLICWDCKCELENGDEYMTYNNCDLIKCRACHEKDPILRNFQTCDVYSRIVGYIQPLKNWNAGKKEEWRDRKTFKHHELS